ncbi:CTD nuclear envelope phosphatase 1 homolog [Gryllus bimaculatus]|nr:CTD nuclear envelope phosphatase 1 homolog [Gryllus bimaculatus]
MGTNCEVIVFPPGKSGKISKWKVKEGTFVSIGRVLLLYDINSSNGREELKKLKATQMGMVRKLLAREGETITPGTALLELEECTHPTVMNAMCAECGADLKTENQNCLKASVPMVHSIPDLKVSREQAELIGKADEERLIKHRKLVLLVDLDQTLIHTTNDNIPPNIKDVYHFQLYGPTSPWYHTRIRPGTSHFLKEMSQLYELHICTFGARNYAHMIATFLDPDGKYFSHRILSRDECFNSSSKTANLSALFPCGDNMVCIIDDREDVWNFAPNLIHVKPYHFFKHTGDINAPPGLTKHENDEKEGFDFSSFENRSSSPENKLQEKAKEVELVKMEDLKNEKDLAKENVEEKETPYTNVEMKDENSDTLKQKKMPGEEKEEENEKLLRDVEVKSCDPDSQPTNVEKQIKNKNPKSENSSDKNTEVKSTSELCPDGGKDSISVDYNTVSKPNKYSESAKDEKENINNVGANDISENIKENCRLDNEGKENECVVNKDEIGEEKSNINNIEIEREVEDSDDYLLYLEGILKTIHHAFYEIFDELQGDMPDLKSVIPYVRRKVLCGTRLVFSGLVPTNVPLEKSRVYQVARSLGAVVSSDIDSKTTHLVAIRSGTAKVNTARRMKNISIVTPEWLWGCAERWEHIEEKLFPLGRRQTSSRHPPPHCGSPEHSPGQLGASRFMDSINPLMSFSSEDIANMDREVEDIFNESESEGEREEKKAECLTENVAEKDIEKENREEEAAVRRAVLEYESSSSSADSLSGEHPHGWRSSESERRKRTVTDSELDDLDEDMPSTKFRRGEALPSDLELGEDDSASNGSDDPPDEIDDGDWNMMGAALEREFLSGDRD